jgi:hypothetical protein
MSHPLFGVGESFMLFLDRRTIAVINQFQSCTLFSTTRIRSCDGEPKVFVDRYLIHKDQKHEYQSAVFYKKSAQTPPNTINQRSTDLQSNRRFSVSHTQTLNYLSPSSQTNSGRISGPQLVLPPPITQNSSFDVSTDEEILSFENEIERSWTSAQIPFEEVIALLGSIVEQREVIGMSKLAEIYQITVFIIFSFYSRYGSISISHLFTNHTYYPQW